MPTSQILLATTKSSSVAPVVPFNLTLDGNYTSNPRLGDTTSEQSTWWGTQAYDTEFVTNIGQQSYQGFYAFTAGKNATLTATLAGASGWSYVRGRSITATFSISVGDRIVFFAGKSGNTGTSLNEGGGGGASCLMKYGSSLSSDADYVNGFVPLIIAAGGGGGDVANGSQANELASAAPPLSTTTGNTAAQIMAVRNNFYPSANLVAKQGGAGRDSTAGGGSMAHTGGNGWAGPSRHHLTGNATDITLSGISYPAVGIAYGAKGNIKLDANSGDGGFGGGGSDYSSNSYGSGGGGYYGGNESVGANSMLNNAYTAYTFVDAAGNAHQTEGDMRHGALSFVHSSGSSVTDNGLYGSSSSYGTFTLSGQQQGRVYLSFTQI